MRQHPDLQEIIARAEEVWEPSVARIWLDSPNAFLAGATPLNVLRVRGPQEVLDALEATRAGAYA